MQARPVQTDIRSCEADPYHALVLGRRYSVVPGVHYNKTLRSLHARSIATFLTCCQMAKLAIEAPGMS